MLLRGADTEGSGVPQDEAGVPERVWQISPSAKDSIARQQPTVLSCTWLPKVLAPGRGVLGREAKVDFESLRGRECRMP